MGKYINIGNTDFASVRKDEYVDKSQLIAYVNCVLGTQRKFLCVTRARRFGKSLAAKMLCAYYDHSCDSRSLFADLKIAQDSTYKDHLNHYPVIYLDASVFTTNLKSQGKQIVHEMNDALSRELIETYPEVPINPTDLLPAQLLSVVEYTHKQSGDGDSLGHTENHTENHIGLSRLQKEVIRMLKANPGCSRRELASKIDNASLGGVISAILRLQELGILRRVGPDKGGHWEVIPTE